LLEIAVLQNRLTGYWEVWTREREGSY